MRVLVGCEFSGRVRDAFIRRGHDAVSCDLLPTERPGPHYQTDILGPAYWGWAWDLLIAFPPCTYLATSGNRKYLGSPEREEALAFVRSLMSAPIPKIAIENPRSVISSRIRRPDQMIEPYWFGDPARKGTCLWLKGLPKLEPTNVVPWFPENDTRHEPRGPERGLNRSRTFWGVARAMAEQWG